MFMEEITLYIYSLHFLFISFIILILINIKQIKSIFKIEKKLWISLLFILIFSSFSFLNTMNYQKPYLLDLTISKEFIFGEGNLWKSSSYYTNNLFGYFGYIFFLIFGINKIASLYINIACFLISISSFFLISNLLIEEKKYTIITTLSYIFFSFYIAGSGVFMLQIFQCFSLLFVLFSLVSYKINNYKTYSLALISSILASTARFELILLIPAFFIGLIIYNWDKTNNLKKIENVFKKLKIPIFLSLLLSSSYIFSFLYHFETHFFINEFNPIGRALKGFFYFFIRGPIIYFTILSIVGFVLIKDKKKKILPLISFTLLLVPYLTCNNCFKERYGIYLFTFILLYFSGLFSRDVIKYLKKNKTIEGIIFKFTTILLIVLIIPYFSFTPSIKIKYDEIGQNEEKIGKFIKSFENKNDNKANIIIPVYGGLDIEYSTLKNIISLENIAMQTNVFREKIKNEKYREEIIVGTLTLFYNKSEKDEAERIKYRLLGETFEELENKYGEGENPLNITEKSYFIEYPYCNEYFESPCKFMKNSFNLTLLYETVEGYKLYELRYK